MLISQATNQPTLSSAMSAAISVLSSSQLRQFCLSSEMDAWVTKRPRLAEQAEPDDFLDKLHCYTVTETLLSSIVM